MKRYALLTVAGALGLGAAPLRAAPPVPAAVPAASIPEQAWYPKGYRDLRIAAASEIATFPRAIGELASDDEYNLAGCGYPKPDEEFLDDFARYYGPLAFTIERIRSDMRRLGYSAEVYEPALLDYERARLAWTATPAGAMPTGREAAINWPSSTRIIGPLGDLAAPMEARRKLVGAGKSITYWNCRRHVFGAVGLTRVSERGPEDVRVQISPPGGRLWLISGFAFRLCERKTGNPWNHFGCGWEEYAPEDGSHSSGRYIYEVRWRDGTVQRGARVLEFDPDDRNKVIRFSRD